jgi:hypothetical protein
MADLSLVASMTARRVTQTSTYALRTTLGRYRATFELLRLDRRLRPRLLHTETDVCIEGFPRSANSLAVHAFRLANPRARIAHHVHVPMQVVRAADLGVPCVVLIRDPLDAIASLLIMSEGALPDGIAIRSYASFYAKVAAVRERVVITPFADVVDDPSVVSRLVNDHFGTTFEALPAEEGKILATERIRAANLARDRPQTWWTIPTDEKNALKPRILERLRNDSRMARARAVYDSLLSNRT